ncbi:MAG: hypothetical protein AAGA66_10890 [Bacteroidota bacterium]
MKERLEQRLSDLKQELEKGQNQLVQLDEQRSKMEKTLLRISGAIQVLKEELEGQTEEHPAEKMPELNGQEVS